jgi:outer membrane receptor protein involved in Fe transport
VDLFGATANLGYDWGTFTLLGSYYKHEILFKFDSTPVLAFNGVGVPGVTVQPQSYETTTAEARFASSFDGFFNFVGGVYYQKDENDFEVNVTTTDNRGNSVSWDELNANDFFAGGTAFFGRFRNDEIEQLGVFGEATFDFLEKWQLAVGARWIDVEIQATQATSHAFVGQLSENLPGELVGHTVNGNEIRLLKQEDDDVIPKVSLSFRATDEVLLYGLYSEGFRVGGVNNANQPFAPGIPPTFKSDNLQNIEFGIKSQWFDERMQINAALFMIDWEDIQVEPRDPLSNIPFTTNGGEAEVNGLEWSITGIPVNYIELMFTGTYFFDHQLTTDQPPLLDASPYVITGLAGDEIPNVSEFQLYWAGTWEGQMASRPLLLTLDATYRDSTNTEFRTDSPFNFKLDSYVVLNTYANYHVTDNISVGLYVKNLTDELALYDGIGTFENPQAVVGNRPRTWGATFSWKLE